METSDQHANLTTKEETSPDDIADDQSRMQILPPRQLRNPESPSQTEPLVDNQEQIQRPARLLISALHELPNPTLSQVSPDSKVLKNILKFPMVMLVLSSASLSGLSTAMVKLTGELI